MFNLFGSESKELVLTYLSKNPYSSPKQIDEEINKYSKLISYKNIFRILTELNEVNVIHKKESKYYLSSEFVEYIKNMSDSMLDTHAHEIFVRNKTDFYNVMLYLDPKGEVKENVSGYLDSWLMQKLDEWYSKFYDPENIEFSKIIEKIEKKFGDRKDISILEVGCGTGRITKQLSSRYKNVVGIDNNEKYIEYVNGKHKGITFEVGDIKDYTSKKIFVRKDKNEESGKFDVILFSWIGLHYNPDLLEVLDNVKKLSSEGSLILILDAYYETEFMQVLNMLRPIDLNQIKLLKEKLNEQLITNFGNLKNEVILNHYEFDNVNSLIDNFKIELTLEESRVWTKEDEEKIKEYLVGKRDKLKIGEGFWLSVVNR
jgi:SAM-dependent methyltransferase